MFSNWIQAVENLAQHSPKSSQDLSADARQARLSLDKGRRGSQSLGTQRPASPAGRSLDGVPRPRSTLEDRIRAKLAASTEASSSNTSSASSTARSTPIPGSTRPLSPASTPLPDSPALSTASIADPLKARSPSPAASQSGLPDTASVDVVWHPLSPTSAPLPDSPPVSPTAVASQSVAAISLHSLVSEGDVREAREAVDDSKETEGLAETTSVEVPSPTLALEHDQTPIPALDSAAEESPIESQAAEAEVVSRETSPYGFVLTEEPPASMDEQSEAAPKEPEGEPINSSPIDDSSPDRSRAEEVSESVTTVQLADSTPSATLLQATEPEQPTVAAVHATEDGFKSLSDAAGHHAATTPQDISIETTVPNSSQDAAGNLTDGSHDVILSIPTTPLPVDGDGLVEGLQKRLKLVEQRFADVSTSFKRLQAEKLAADKVLQELTPLQSLQEADSLRDYLQNMNMKTEMAQDEIKRLTGKLTRRAYRRAQRHSPS
ncbi:hypothetical protein DAEQUDRAFT_543432 [Daedalea quercina L-15889]|uniref:Uncharacterized protein n=1 Tax=Daedalea quercina L-15889 TaxID=1314783 RepID=A0A165T034_9APHY|nr:hypothetical protein DAEQUDRAFT_543432 [Daedalea quercina L-15889]